MISFHQIPRSIMENTANGNAQVQNTKDTVYNS